MNDSVKSIRLLQVVGMADVVGVIDGGMLGVELGTLLLLGIELGIELGLLLGTLDGETL